MNAKIVRGDDYTTQHKLTHTHTSSVVRLPEWLRSYRSNVNSCKAKSLQVQ
jgi:hypothetical protein